MGLESRYVERSEGTGCAEDFETWIGEGSCEGVDGGGRIDGLGLVRNLIEIV